MEMQADQSEGISVSEKEESHALPMYSAPSEVELYRKVRSSLDSGQFEPGDRLPPERDLADLYGTSRHLIRRAIQRLELEGRLERAVGKGTFVSKPVDALRHDSTEDAGTVSPIDVLEARLVIEPGFSDLLVLRATQNDFTRLEALLGKLEVARTQQEFREAGYSFHLGLAQTTRNPLLVRIFEVIVEARANAGWGRLQRLNDTAEARSVQARSNRAILDALKERDAHLVRNLLRGHLGAMLASVTHSQES